MKAGATQPRFSILFFFFFISMAVTLTTSAQKEVDAIYLYNGNVIRGFLIDQPDSSVVHIETLSHNIYQFSKGEIASVRKELLNKRKYKSFIPKGKGYDNITDFGLLAGSGNNDRNVIFSILTTHKYTLQNGMAPGLGIGLEFFEQPSLPVYGSFSWQLGTQKFSPFATVRAGYAFGVGSPYTSWDYTYDSSGGMMLSAGAGTKIWVSHRNAFVISLLYRYQAIHSVRTWAWSDATNQILKKYYRLEIRFGLQF